MKANDNATATDAETPKLLSRALHPGLGLGFLGVLAFSFSLPANKVALAGLDPLGITTLRAAGAGLLAGAYLLIARAELPNGRLLRDLALSSLGVAIGYPLFTSLALLTNNTGHSAVILGLLPAVTAIFGALVGDERLPLTFWMACLSGVGIVVGYLAIIAYQETGAITPRLGDLWLLAAIGSVCYGYALGTRAARAIGGPGSISWALVLLLPVSLPAAGAAQLAGDPHWTPKVALGLAYVLLFSQFLGFFAWYGGLARGGLAHIGQVQQVQPLLTLAWAALLLGERFNPWTILVGGAITVLVAIAQRARFAEPLDSASARSRSSVTKSSIRSYGTGSRKRNFTES